jgi:hypothetical protein
LVLGQTEQKIEEKYGKPLKAYQVGDSIYMIPQYNIEGQLWLATLYYSRISTNHDIHGLHGNGTLNWEELQKVIADIAPKSMRGELKKVYEDDSNGIRSATYDYENVSIHFTSFSKEEDVTVATFNTDPQVLENQSVVIKKIPRSKVRRDTSEEFSSGICRTSEFVQIFWLNRMELNRSKDNF